MTAVSWRDGVRELRRLVAAEGGDPDRIQDVDLAYIPAVEWHDRVPGESSGDANDLDLADTVQIEMELTFSRGATAEADDFWTAARSGEYDAAALAEAGELVTGLGLGRPLVSRIALTNCN